MIEAVGQWQGQGPKHAAKIRSVLNHPTTPTRVVQLIQDCAVWMADGTISRYPFEGALYSQPGWWVSAALALASAQSKGREMRRKDKANNPPTPRRPRARR